MSYQESLLDQDINTEISQEDAIKNYGGKENKLTNALKIFALVAFLILMLFAPGLLQDKTRHITYTFLSCLLDSKTNMCTAHYSIFTSNQLQPSRRDETIIARGYYDELLDQIGWSTLAIESFQPAHDRQQVDAVGFLEGYLTQERITHVLTNDNATMWNTRPIDAQDRLLEWFAQQQTYIQSQIDINVYDTTGKISPANQQYWKAVELTQLQHNGMKVGYEQRLKELDQLVLFDLGFWSKRPEFGDTLNSIYPERTKNCWDMSVSELDVLMGEEHCSSISKTTIDFSNQVTCHPIGPISLTTTPIKGGNVSTPTSFQSKTIPINDKVECTVNFFLDFVIMHDTWTSFIDLIRIVKKYTMELDLYHETHNKSNSNSNSNDNDDDDKIEPWVLSLSGYPGLLTSYDDYYVMPSSQQQLIVTETTNTNCNKELWLKNSPRSIPTTQRTIIASLLANTAPQWADIFTRENSGTYNNQWMIIDTKLWDPSPEAKQIEYVITPYPNQIEQLSKITTPTTFENGHELFFTQITKTAYPQGFYYIAEQAPGFIKSKDVINVINEATYWRSYNRPYTSDVYFAMGFDKATDGIGDYYSYTDYARAQVMARDLAIKPTPSTTTITHENSYPVQNTTSFFDLMTYMRFNDFQNDPLTRYCPIYAIASRNDLIPPEGCGKPLSKAAPRGQTDVKASSVNSIRGDYINIDEKFITNPILTQQIDVIDWGRNQDAHNTKKKNNPPKKQDTKLNQDALFWIIAGPTNQQQKPFTWDDPRWVNFTHVGHPPQFEFNWIQLNH